MAHTHEHDPGGYYADQLCTIGICGALGFITLMLYCAQYQLLGVRGHKILGLLLHVRLHLFVLVGGIILLALVAVRAAAVWFTAGQQGEKAEASGDCRNEHHETCPHNHEHTEAANHAPAGCCPGEHAEGHGHTWSPWRYVVLLLPVVLYFLNLPNEGFALAGNKGVKLGEIAGDIGALADKGADYQVGFLELERASYTPESRRYYEGKTVELIGQYAPGPSEQTFGLVRYKMNCCAADAIPLSALTMLDPKSPEKLPAGLQGKWVKVQGQVQFRERRDRLGVYQTVVLVQPTPERPLHKLVEPIGQPDSPFLY